MIALTPLTPPATLTLAWQPFFEPLTLGHAWLFLIIPMALAIAVVYKAIRLDDLSLLPRKALVMAGQIVVCMALGAVVLWLITEWI
ncbi:MAG: hypothetical protein WD042_01140 [Phycisphaeraceae bacterium]